MYHIPTTLAYGNRLTNCVECGDKMVSTGNSRTARSPRPTFNRYVGDALVLVEYKCASCGQSEWCEAGVVVVETVFEGV